MIKLLVSLLPLLLVANGQMDYWSPYSPEAMHYSSPLSSQYPSQAARNFNPFYNHHNTPGGQFASPLVASAYPPTLVPSTHQCGAPAAAPKIDWGDCPSLESKEEDAKMKQEKQKECMKNLELNENTTFAELTPVLQNRVRECTLRKDELINEAGKYNYEKAMERLKGKNLPENLTKKVEEAHVECKIEAEQKFRNSATSLAEVDSYNECMDFHLAMMCKIKVKKSDVKVSNANSFHGILPLPYASQANVHSSHNFGDVMNKIQILSQALKR